MKYKALVIKRETAYVNNDGQIINPTFEQVLLSRFLGEDKIHLIELFTKVGSIQAKTKRLLNDAAWDCSHKNNLFDNFEVFLLS